ncbi:MAG TPA: Rieske 2Fe-2S domain-containing protein [Cellvibrio sp.]|nr:Rieske 2Fe-2S domain-containing protein [Cellvibrio sp.]
MGTLSTNLHIDQIPEGESRGFKHNGEELFAVKKNGKLFVYRNRCPHLGVDLNWQKDQFLDASRTMIQCANHGALFVIENGKCVSGPCSGRKLISVSVDIIDGIIFTQ